MPHQWRPPYFPPFVQAYADKPAENANAGKIT
jgi:hypothetical protein